MVKCEFCLNKTELGTFTELVLGFNTIKKVLLCNKCLKNMETGINKCIGSVSNEKIQHSISIIRSSDMDRIGDELQKYINEADKNEWV
jgi:hypothetical protein